MLETDEELEELNQLADTVKKFFDEKVDSAKLDKQAEFDPDVLQVNFHLLECFVCTGNLNTGDLNYLL